MDAFSTCFDFVKVAVNHRLVIEEEEKSLENSWVHCYLHTDIYIFLHVTLFIMHVEVATVAEKEFDIVIPMTVECVLVPIQGKRNERKRVTFNKDM